MKATSAYTLLGEEIRGTGAECEAGAKNAITSIAIAIPSASQTAIESADGLIIPRSAGSNIVATISNA